MAHTGKQSQKTKFVFWSESDEVYIFRSYTMYVRSLLVAAKESTVIPLHHIIEFWAQDLRIQSSNFADHQCLFGNSGFGYSAYLLFFQVNWINLLKRTPQNFLEQRFYSIKLFLCQWHVNLTCNETQVFHLLVIFQSLGWIVSHIGRFEGWESYDSKDSSEMGAIVPECSL